MDSAKLTVALEEADVVAAFRLHGRLSRESWLSYATMSVVALGLGIWILASPRFPGFMNILGAIAIGATAGWWVFTLASTLLLPRRLHRKIHRSGAALGTYELDWTEDAFVFENLDNRIRKPWGELVKWRQDKRVFLVYFTPRLFWIVPKRLFAGAGERESFAALLREKIGPENRTRPTS